VSVPVKGGCTLGLVYPLLGGTNMLDSRLDSAWWAMRITYGLVPIVAGLDKYTNLLAHWTDYLSPLVTRILPVAPSTFMHVIGVVEIAVGIAVLTKFTRYAAYVLSVYFVGIALNLVTTGHDFDVAVRDVVIAIGAFALARMTEVKEDVRTSAFVATPATAPTT
jgi:uncharacterized membrane protein YphA (DoxX/SURF4 family)